MSDAPDLDLRQLRYFVQLTRDLSFTKAAKQLFIAQQTLSESVAQLERILEVRLVERHPQGVHITEAGAALARKAEALLDAAREAVLEARSIDRRSSGTITVGTPDWPSGVELFRAAIRTYAARRGIAPQIDPLPWISHLDAVAHGRLDVGVTFLSSPDQLPRSLTAHRILTDDSGWLLVSELSPFARVESVSASELAETPILYIQRRDHPGLNRALHDRLEALGLPGGNGANDGAFASAVAHAGVSDAAVWVSATIAQSPPAGTTAVRAPELAMPLDLVAITRATEDRPAVHELVGVIQEQGQRLNP